MATAGVRSGYDMLQQFGRPANQPAPNIYRSHPSLPEFSSTEAPLGRFISPEMHYTTAAQLAMQRQQQEGDMEMARFKASLAERQAQSQQAQAQKMMQYFQNQMGQPTAPVKYDPSGNLSQVQAEEFARAKDRTGNIARSALMGLKEQMASRGISGSGPEVQAMAEEVLAPGIGQLGNVTAAQLREAMEQAQHGADVRYQGEIAQRSQDMQRQQALLGLMQSMGVLY